MSDAVVGAIAHEHHDATGAKIGMWLFLFTEFLLFGGLFLLYAVYRSKFPEDFHFAATTLDVGLGTVNTAILLTSSLTMVLSVATHERDDRRLSTLFLALTMLLGMAFLVNKVFEWSAKIDHGLFPGAAELATHAPGEKLFYGLYYAMTGLHGLHVLVGVGVMAFVLRVAARRPRRRVRLGSKGVSRLALTAAAGSELWAETPDDAVEEIEVAFIYGTNEELAERDRIVIENTGLYWHLVDIIWIFLFPLFYLIT